MCNWPAQETKNPASVLGYLSSRRPPMIIIPKTTALPNLLAVSGVDLEDEDTVLEEYPMTAVVRQGCRLLFPFEPPATQRYGGTWGEWEFAPLKMRTSCSYLDRSILL